MLRQTVSDRVQLRGETVTVTASERKAFVGGEENVLCRTAEHHEAVRSFCIALERVYKEFRALHLFLEQLSQSHCAVLSLTGIQHFNLVSWSKSFAADRKQAGRQAGRQADRHTDRNAGRQAGRQTGRQKKRQAGRQADMTTGRQAGRQIDRKAGRQQNFSSPQLEERQMNRMTAAPSTPFSNENETVLKALEEQEQQRLLVPSSPTGRASFLRAYRRRTLLP
eukprot:749415-Hanusia_phi.AAC.1